MINQNLQCTCEREPYGEKITRLFLEKNNIIFQQNYYQQIGNDKFEFDFKIEHDDIKFIEIDGRFHKESFNRDSLAKELEIIKQRDNIRNNFAGEQLLRIDVSSLSKKKIKLKIEETLKEKLKLN
jgi:hypothetical protein